MLLRGSFANMRLQLQDVLKIRPELEAADVD